MASPESAWNAQSWTLDAGGSWRPPDYAARATGQLDSTEIASITVDQITAGTLKSKVILGGSIKTALTGARVEQDASGIRLYDAGNVLTVNLDATTGAGTFTGTITGSAISGGTITGGAISGGTITGTTITGGTIQTAASGHRTVLDGTLGGSLRLFTADANELLPAFIFNAIDTTHYIVAVDTLNFQNSVLAGNAFAQLSLVSGGGLPPWVLVGGKGGGAASNPNNLGIGDHNMTFGGGSGVFGIQEAWVAPAATYVAGGILYVQGGALKYRGSAGTVTTIAAS